MWYAIYRDNVERLVRGFITDDDDIPICSRSEAALERRLETHPLMVAGLIELVKI